MKIYLAHPVTDYGTKRQADAIAYIREGGFEVENPDQPHHQRGYEERGMDYFKEVVAACDGLVFLRFPDGSVGAGVGREIWWALKANKNVWELFGGRLYWCADKPTPVLSVDETRATIARIREEPHQ